MYPLSDHQITVTSHVLIPKFESGAKNAVRAIIKWGALGLAALYLLIVFLDRDTTLNDFWVAFAVPLLLVAIFLWQTRGKKEEVEETVILTASGDSLIWEHRARPVWKGRRISYQQEIYTFPIGTISAVVHNFSVGGIQLHGAMTSVVTRRKEDGALEATPKGRHQSHYAGLIFYPAPEEMELVLRWLEEKTGIMRTHYGKQR